MVQESGLSSQHAAQLLSQFGPNIIESQKKKGFLSQLLEVLKEPMLLLLIAAAAISFTLGEPAESLILSIGILLVVGISLFQTIRTDNAIAALRQLTAPRVTAIRDGKERSIPTAELVPGDVVLVREGDKIAADCRLLESTNLKIDESLLTGESLAIEKTQGEEIFSGTVVLVGHGMAKVLQTGATSRIGQIGTLLSGQVENRTPLQSEISGLVRVISVVALLAAIAVTVVYSISRNDWLTGALAGISASMALLPEELPIVLTVFLGLGSLRLSRQKVIVRRAATIEALGSITVLCADKTGTITENKMVLVDTPDAISRVGKLASPLRPVDPMDKAFVEVNGEERDGKLLREYPIGNGVMAVHQVWDLGGEDLVVAAKGAPEFIIQRTLTDPSQAQTQLALAAQKATSGFRVLAVAQGVLPRAFELPADSEGFSLNYLGLAFLSDPVRPGVAESVKMLRGAGIRTLMITGDHPGTASATAEAIGIPNPNTVLTGPEISELSDDELLGRLHEINVFSRMQPEQKLRLVTLLQAAGEVVAMTGDGVNDAPALKRAHVGISMGTRGSEVAREASDMVVTDDSFISIANGIAEGRKIYGNLKKAATYIIAIHVPIFIMALVPLFESAWPLILLPAQIAILELIIDPASSVAYQAEPAEKEQMRVKPRKLTDRLVDKRSLYSALLQGLLLSFAALVVFATSLESYSDGQVRLLVFVCLLAGNLFLMVSNRSATNSLLALVRKPNNAALVLFLIGVVTIVAIASLEWVQNAFRLEGVPLQSIMLAILLALLPVLAHEGLKWFQRRKVVRSDLQAVSN